MESSKLLQLSELFRRGIVTPKTNEAEKELRSFWARRDTDVLRISIADEVLFSEI